MYLFTKVMLLCIEPKYNNTFAYPTCVVTKQLIKIEYIYLYMDLYMDRPGVSNKRPTFLFKYIYLIIIVFSWLNLCVVQTSC